MRVAPEAARAPNRRWIPMLALAGVGLLLGVLMVADRPASADTFGGAYPKADFDRAFAPVVPVSARHAEYDAVLRESLVLQAAKRLAPMPPVEKLAIVRTKVVTSDATALLLNDDSTLHATRLDKAAIFRMLLAQPFEPTMATQFSATPPGAAASGF